ncbi:MAG: hypothetical protein KDJ35_09125 [Alphaproteobacteria bacterium]|nr:hypothetical protein [Alphaproteobacteria bacterium]
MFTYFKCGESTALFIEFSKNLGAHPYFEVKTCNGETIVDIPYGQFIFTPPKRLVKSPKKPDKVREKIKKAYDGRENKNIHAPPQRVAEN